MPEIAGLHFGNPRGCRAEGQRVQVRDDFQFFDGKVTLPETNMETQKGPYKDYSPSDKGTIWVSMLVWGSVSHKIPWKKVPGFRHEECRVERLELRVFVWGMGLRVTGSALVIGGLRLRV